MTLQQMRHLCLAAFSFFITQALLSMMLMRGYRLGFHDGELHYVEKRTITKRNILQYPFRNPRAPGQGSDEKEGAQAGRGDSDAPGGETPPQSA